MKAIHSIERRITDFSEWNQNSEIVLTKLIRISSSMVCECCQESGPAYHVYISMDEDGKAIVKITLCSGCISVLVNRLNGLNED